MSIRIGRESKSDNLIVCGIPRGGVIVTDIEGTNRCSRMSNWSFWYEENYIWLVHLG
ncbi:MAG TPA: hypothetical protein VI033_08320 [Candidatus Nitrosopolaris sp.]